MPTLGQGFRGTHGNPVLLCFYCVYTCMWCAYRQTVGKRCDTLHAPLLPSAAFCLLYGLPRPKRLIRQRLYLSLCLCPSPHLCLVPLFSLQCGEMSLQHQSSTRTESSPVFATVWSFPCFSPTCSFGLSEELAINSKSPAAGAFDDSCSRVSVVPLARHIPLTDENESSSGRAVVYWWQIGPQQ